MKFAGFFSVSVSKLIASVMLLLTAGPVINGQAWFDNEWPFRRPVTIPNPAGIALTDYQSSIILNSSNFNFPAALADGSDVRVTGNDGVTPIPFWIETWDHTGQAAQIWVKIPELQVGGSTVYIYYGNADAVVDPPVLTETPPAGPFIKSASNPIVPIGDPYITDPGRSIIAENIVFDPVTGHYWMIFANYRSGQSVGLVWSDDPANPDAWHWYDGAVISNANAPHIMYHEGLWYIFYADRAVPSPYPIAVQSSASVTGPYSNKQTVLLPTEAWEAYRVRDVRRTDLQEPGDVMTERLLKISIFGLMVLLVILVSLQVFTRYVMNDPTSWSEEAASFTQVFLVFLGGSLAIFQKKTLRMTFFVDRLSPRTGIVLEFVLKILILLFLVTMIWYSFSAMARLHNQITPGLRWHKSFIFAAVPLGGVLMLVATLRELRESLRKWRSLRQGQEGK